MNERQYNIIKIFLDGLRVPAKRLAREWGLSLDLVTRAQMSSNFAAFQDNDTPYEDMMRTMEL